MAKLTTWANQCTADGELLAAWLEARGEVLEPFAGRWLAEHPDEAARLWAEFEADRAAEKSR